MITPVNRKTPYQIGFVGFGLIGGSIAKALKKKHADCLITVTSRRLDPLYAAKSAGVIDTVTGRIDNSFSACDFIFLCTPVESAESYLPQLKRVKKEGCIITDVGSVKGSIHKAAADAGLAGCFIGGHPMAGSEQSGYASSSADLFKGSTYVLTPSAETGQDQLDAYRALVLDLGAVPLVMDCDLHDVSVAGISHVPHLAAAALAKFVQLSDDPGRHMHALAAGGFKDTTRIAASSPEMWAQICTANRAAIGGLLDRYIAQLTEIHDRIAGDASKEQVQSYITNLFQTAGQYRNSFDETGRHD